MRWEAHEEVQKCILLSAFFAKRPGKNLFSVSSSSFSCAISSQASELHQNRRRTKFYGILQKHNALTYMSLGLVNIETTEKTLFNYLHSKGHWVRLRSKYCENKDMCKNHEKSLMACYSHYTKFVGKIRIYEHIRWKACCIMCFSSGASSRWREKVSKNIWQERKTRSILATSKLPFI